MNAVDNGGPAFPRAASKDQFGELPAHLGVSLRDYFAAKAMQSLILEGAGFNSAPNQIHPMVATAYAWADAMLSARQDKS